MQYYSYTFEKSDSILYVWFDFWKHCNLFVRDILVPCGITTLPQIEGKGILTSQQSTGVPENWNSREPARAFVFPGDLKIIIEKYKSED